MPRLLCLVVMMCLLASGIASGQTAAKSAASPIDGWIADQRDSLLSLYTELHSHPELCYQEVEASSRIANE